MPIPPLIDPSMMEDPRLHRQSPPPEDADSFLEGAIAAYDALDFETAEGQVLYGALMSIAASLAVIAEQQTRVANRMPPKQPI